MFSDCPDSFYGRRCSYFRSCKVRQAVFSPSAAESTSSPSLKAAPRTPSVTNRWLPSSGDNAVTYGCRRLWLPPPSVLAPCYGVTFLIYFISSSSSGVTVSVTTLIDIGCSTAPPFSIGGHYCEMGYLIWGVAIIRTCFNTKAVFVPSLFALSYMKV